MLRIGPLIEHWRRHTNIRGLPQVIGLATPSVTRRLRLAAELCDEPAASKIGGVGMPGWNRIVGDIRRRLRLGEKLRRVRRLGWSARIRLLPKGVAHVHRTGVIDRPPAPLSAGYGNAAMQIAVVEASSNPVIWRLRFIPQPKSVVRHWRWRQVALLARSHAVGRELIDASSNERASR